MSVFKRKAFYALKDWKENFAPHYAALLEGARRVGKSTIAEEFAKENYRSFIKIDFANVEPEVLFAFDGIAKLDIFFYGFRLLQALLCILVNLSSFLMKFSCFQKPDRQSNIL